MRSRLALVIAVSLAPAILASQGAEPPVHGLGPVLASIPMRFPATRANVPGAWFGIVPLSDGRVLVREGQSARRVVRLFDSTLQTSTVVVDSARRGTVAFTLGSTVMPFRGDSTLFFALDVWQIAVIDPSGRVARTFPPPLKLAETHIPGMQTLPAMASSTLGLIYHENLIWTREGFIRARGPARPGVARDTLYFEDSTLLVRMSFDGGRHDTLAKLSNGRGVTAIVTADAVVPRMGGGGLLFPTFDGAVVTSDGSLAILRASELRLDRIDGTGTLRMGPRLSYTWRRITDDERRRITDSVMRARRPTTPPQSMHIPEFWPAVGPNAMMADADNNVWIALNPARPDPPGTTWHVYDSASRLIDRVFVPRNRTIIAFGKGGFAFVTDEYVGTATMTIHKVRIKP